VDLTTVMVEQARAPTKLDYSHGSLTAQDIAVQQCSEGYSVIGLKQRAWLAQGAHRDFVRLLRRGRDMAELATSVEDGYDGLNQW
jgi:hypothetical protein